MKSDLVLYRSPIINFMIAIASILLLNNLVDSNNIIMVNQQPELFLILLFGGGIYISSIAFRNLHKSPKKYFFMMLPASNAEKFLATWLLTSIGYAVFVLLFYSFFYWLIALLIFIFTKKNYFISIPFLPSTWQSIFFYLMLQPIPFLGSIYFKRYALAKTFFILCCVSLFLKIITSFFITTTL